MSDRTSKHVTNFAGDCASTCPACSEVVKAQQRLRAALSLVGECLSRGYWKIGTELTQRANAAIIEALSGDSPSPVETSARQQEAFRIINAATYYVPRPRQLHAEMVAWLNGASTQEASPEEPPAECDHPRSELLASKGDQFEMRKCLECTKIFRVRLRVNGSRDETITNKGD